MMNQRKNPTAKKAPTNPIKKIPARVNKIHQIQKKMKNLLLKRKLNLQRTNFLIQIIRPSKKFTLYNQFNKRLKK